MDKLKLSICIVALNEEAFLPDLLENIREQQYPRDYTEIVLVDSGSTDRTKSMMQSFCDEENGFYSVQVLNNPKKNQAAGWNVAISNATGDVILRIDAHSMLPREFSALIMEEINKGENVVGGIRPCITKNNTPWGKTLLATENSMFGSSINNSKRSKERQYVKTMFHAAYRKEVFKKIGLFNEKLLRTEDNEMHYRIRKAGYRLCYDPNIISYQYSRSNLKTMLKQKYENGYWIGLTIGVCPGCISIYHLVPAAFVMGIVITTILAIVDIWQFSAVMWGLYALFCFLNTFVSIVREKIFPHMLIMPALFFFSHLSYGIGTIIGLMQIPRKRKELISE